MAGLDLGQARFRLGLFIGLKRALTKDELALLLGVPSGERTITNWQNGGVPQMADTLVRTLLTSPVGSWPQDRVKAVMDHANRFDENTP